jgi:hypothetical protein
MSISPEEKEALLQHEAFIKEVLALREEKAKDSQPKPAWQRFLESTGGTAFITVLIGGIMGSIITGLFQAGAKDREAQQAQLAARSNQAQVAYKEYLDKELETVNRALDLIGGCISASDDLIESTTPVFDSGNYKGKDREDIEQQVVGFFDEYNDTDKRWRREQYKIGLLIGYYHHGKPGVITAWQDVQNSVTTYMDCANDLSVDYDNSKPIEKYGSCKAQKQKLRDYLDNLTKSFEADRQYTWNILDTPDKLR